jgi:hypothetical protein
MPTYSIDLRCLTARHIDAVSSRLIEAQDITKSITIRSERNPQRITVVVSNEQAFTIALHLSDTYRDAPHEYLQSVLADVP